MKGWKVDTETANVALEDFSVQIWDLFSEFKQFIFLICGGWRGTSIFTFNVQFHLGFNKGHLEDQNTDQSNIGKVNWI